MAKKKKAKNTNVDCHIYSFNAKDVKKQNDKKWNDIDKSVKKREKQLDKIIKLLEQLVTQITTI